MPSYSLDQVARAWGSTHEAPVEEAFGDFLIVGTDKDDIKERVPYVVQVDGTVAFGEPEEVVMEEVDEADLAPSERLDLAVGEVGLGATVIALAAGRTNVAAYTRRSKSGKIVRVRSYWRLLDVSSLSPGDEIQTHYGVKKTVKSVNGPVATMTDNSRVTGKVRAKVSGDRLAPGPAAVERAVPGSHSRGPYAERLRANFIAKNPDVRRAGTDGPRDGGHLTEDRLRSLSDAALADLRKDIERKGQGAKGPYDPGSMRQVIYEQQRRDEAVRKRTKNPGDLAVGDRFEHKGYTYEVTRPTEDMPATRLLAQEGGRTPQRVIVKGVAPYALPEQVIVMDENDVLQVEPRDPGPETIATREGGEFIAEDVPYIERGAAGGLANKVTTDGGFTYDPRYSRYVEHGFAVAVPGNSKIVKDEDFTGETAVNAILEYLDEHADELDANPRLHLGGWHDTEHGEVVLDLSEIFEDQREAMAAGAARNEQAIFDLDSLTEIPTGGTGGREDYLGLSNDDTPLPLSPFYMWEEASDG